MITNEKGLDPAIIQSHKNQKHRYEKLFHDHQISHQSLHFHSTHSQIMRFLQFLKLGELHGKKILDLGCGLGDLFLFLKQQGITVDYTGYDIVSGFIAHSQKTYPGTKFEDRDILFSTPEQNFDYILCSGIFAHGNREFFEEMTKTAFQLCKTAYAFNMFESREDDFFKICQQEVLFTCRSLKPKNIKVIKNYLPNDYTVFLYK